MGRIAGAPYNFLWL